MLRVTLTKGLVGKKDTHIKVIRALGLRKHGSSVLHHDSPTIRGMINKVHYLVTVTEEAETDHAKQARAAKIAAKAPVKKAEPKAAVKTEAKAKAPLKKAEPKAESKPAAKTPAKAAK